VLQKFLRQGEVRELSERRDNSWLLKGILLFRLTHWRVRNELRADHNGRDFFLEGYLPELRNEAVAVLPRLSHDEINYDQVRINNDKRGLNFVADIWVLKFEEIAVDLCEYIGITLQRVRGVVEDDNSGSGHQSPTLPSVRRTPTTQGSRPRSVRS
jgi:hypothetical protein